MATTKKRVQSAQKVIEALLRALRDADAAAGMKEAWTEERPQIMAAQQWLGGLTPFVE